MSIRRARALFALLFVILCASMCHCKEASYATTKARYTNNLFSSKNYVISSENDSSSSNSNKSMRPPLVMRPRTSASGNQNSCTSWIRSDTYCYATDLILYYNMNGPTGGSGTYICDKSKYAYDCDLIIQKGANVGYDPSLMKNSLTTGNANLVRSVVNATKIKSALLASGAYTIEIWAKPTGGSNNLNSENTLFAYANNTQCNTISGGGLSSAKFNIKLAQSSGTLRHRLKTNRLVDPSCGAIDEDSQFSMNTRKQHVVVFNTTHTAVYLNGAIQDSIPFSFDSTLGSSSRDLSSWSSTFLISLGNDLAENGAWVGNIDSVAVWRSALSEEQIKKLYRSNGAPNSTCVNKVEPIISCVAKIGNTEKCLIMFGYRNNDLEPLSQVLIANNTNENMVRVSSVPGVATPVFYTSIFLSGEHKNAFNLSGVPCSIIGDSTSGSISWTIDSSGFGPATVSTPTDYAKSRIKQSVDLCLPFHRRMCAFPRIAHDFGLAASGQDNNNNNNENRVRSELKYSVSWSAGSSGSSSSLLSSPIPLLGMTTPVSYYGYNTPDLQSSNTGLEALVSSGSVWMTILEYDPSNKNMTTTTTTTSSKDGDTKELYLLLSYGTASSNKFSGTAEVSITIDKEKGNYGASYFPLQFLDDPSSLGDWYTWDNATYTLRIRNSWPSCTNDGFVIGPIDSCANITFMLPESSLGCSSPGVIGFVTYNSSSNAKTFTVLKNAVPTTSTRITVCPLCHVVTQSTSPPESNNNSTCGEGSSICPDTRCVYYDQCGRCNGDNTTCPWVQPRCCDGLFAGDWSLDQQASCNVSSWAGGSNFSSSSYGNANEVVISASGSYIVNITDVTVRIQCTSNLSAQAVVNSMWQVPSVSSTFQVLPNGKRLQKKSFSIRIGFELLKSCLGVDSSLSNSTYVSLYGVVNITSFFVSNYTYAQVDSIISSYLAASNSTALMGYLNGMTNSIHYFVPCKIRIQATKLSTGSDCVTIKYTTGRLDPPDVQLIKQVWTMNNKTGCDTSYKDMITVFETCIKKPFGYHTRLLNATILASHYYGNVGAKLVFGSPCLMSHPMGPSYCCQQWGMITTDGERVDCVDFGLKINFTIQISNAPFPTEPPLGSDWYVKSNTVVKNFGDDAVPDSSTIVQFREKVCKPQKCLPTILSGGATKSCDVTYGLYGDAGLTRKTTEFIECQRIYLKAEADCGDSQCDSVDLRLLWAKFCMWRSDLDEEGTPRSCDSSNPNVETFIIADSASGYFGPAILQTSISPVPGRESCTGKLLLSWIAPYIGDRTILIQAKYQYGQETKELTLGNGYLVSNAWSLKQDKLSNSGLLHYNRAKLANALSDSMRLNGSSMFLFEEDSGGVAYYTGDSSADESSVSRTNIKSFKGRCSIRCEESDCTKRYSKHEHHHFNYDHYYWQNYYFAYPGWLSVIFGYRGLTFGFIIVGALLLCIALCCATVGQPVIAQNATRRRRKKTPRAAVGNQKRLNRDTMDTVVVVEVEMNNSTDDADDDDDNEDDRPLLRMYEQEGEEEQEQE